MTTTPARGGPVARASAGDGDRPPARRTVALVVNPTAGHGRGREAGLLASQLLTRAGIEVLDVSGASVAQVVAALERPARSVDAVHVEAVVPGGRPHDPAHGDDAWGGRWYAGVLSLGLDADVNARANTYSWPSGHGRYVRAVFACLAGFSPYGYRLTTDAGTQTFRGTLVAVASSSQIGGGLRIAPDAAVDDGLLDVVYATELSRRGILRLFPRLYKGTHLSHPAVHVVRTTSVVIEASGDGRVPPVAFADGEVVGPVPLSAQVHPGALRVLA